VPLAIGVSPAALLVVGVPLTVGISPTSLVVLVVGVPLAVGVGPAALVVVAGEGPGTGVDAGDTNTTFGATESTTVALARQVDAGDPATLLVLTIVLAVVVLAVVVLAVVVLTIVPVLAVIVLAVLIDTDLTTIVGDELAVDIVALAVLARRIPLAGFVVRINRESERGEGGDSQHKQAVDQRVAHFGGLRQIDK
jgi:hypothetical protein